MIDYEKVYELVSKMASLDYISMHDITYYCQSAIAVISSKIKNDADVSDIRLIMAAATLAYCRYLQNTCLEDSDITNLKAGDVTVRKDSKAIISAAESMVEKAFADASELFEDNYFTFTSV